MQIQTKFKGASCKHIILFYQILLQTVQYPHFHVKAMDSIGYTLHSVWQWQEKLQGSDFLHNIT